MVYFRGFVFILFLAVGIRPTAASDTATFLVFPPDNLTGNPALSWVGEALALSIGTQLGIPGVSAFSREDRLGFVEGADLPPNSALSLASMIHIAQQVSANRLVMGSVRGTAEKLRVTLRVVGVKALKPAGEAAVEGPLVALPEMENELAWMVLEDSGLTRTGSREKFRERRRTIPNSAYEDFIRSLTQSDPEERVKLLNQAVESSPVFPEAHAKLGQHYFEKGDCVRCIPHLERAGALEENRLENQFRLGTCYLKQGSLPEAVRAFSIVLAVVQSPQVLNNLGVAYLRKGEYALAAESLIEARRMSQTEPTILTNLAIVRHLQGDDAGARSLLEHAVKMVRNRAMTQFVLGIILALQGEQEQSVLALAEARRLGADPEKLSTEDPKNWARPFTTWSGPP